MFLCDIKYSGSDVFHDGFLNYIKFMSNKTVAWLGRFFSTFAESKILETFLSKYQSSRKNLT